LAFNLTELLKAPIQAMQFDAETLRRAAPAF
jgi:hypothetical protein